MKIEISNKTLLSLLAVTPAIIILSNKGMSFYNSWEWWVIVLGFSVSNLIINNKD